ncbi:MAG: hypothetical protein NZM25_05590 [Leptospiraceae bacterium]|nr:hypothetical protein [Leptospiraceae bacterium]
MKDRIYCLVAKSLRAILLPSIIILYVSCSKKVSETEFSRNLKRDKESAKTYTPEEWRRAIGKNYDILIAGIGEESFQTLAYGAGVSNMTQLINAIGDGTKLVALMSDPNRLTAIEVLDLLLQTNTAVTWPGASSTNTIGKVANLINSVSLEGMKSLKEIIRGLEPTTSFDVGDPGIANGKRAMLRLGYFLALVDENMSVLPTIINQVGAPGGVYSSQGTRRILRIINEIHDVKELAAIINATTSLSNITSILSGLTEDDTCTVNNPATGKPYTTQAACTANGGSWLIGSARDGIAAMIRIINESGICSNPTLRTKSACRLANQSWSSNTHKLSQIVNFVTNVNNLNEIMNKLTNDGNPGSDKGVDAMVATLNHISNVHRLTYVVNNLDTVPTASNDENFDNGTDCANGLFANRLGIAFSANGPAGAPWWGHGWRSGTGIVDGGVCSARTNPAAATEDTRVLVMEMTANVLETGNLTFRAYTNLAGGASFKLYVNNVARLNIASPGAWSTFNYAISSPGRYRFRWELVRPIGDTSQVWVDSIQVPGEKGAPRTAAEKVAIMLNKLRINSITNVAEILNGVSAPACVNTPHTCTPTNNNGLDALIGIINRVEYPTDINSDPKLVTIVKDLTSVPTMVDILNGLNGNGFERMVFAIDFNDNASNLVGLVNGLTGVNAGNKITDVVNNLTAAGASNLVRMIDGVPNRNMQILINNIPSTSDVAVILNNLFLHGKDVPLNTNAGADGGEKLAAVFNELQNVSVSQGHWPSCSKVFGETPSSQIYVNPPYGPYVRNPNENLFCIENHLARLIIDIGSFSGGAVNVAKIVSYLDPDAPVKSGMRRMVEVLWELRTMSSPRYNDATSNATADIFGRLTTLVGDMGANGGYNIASLVNGTTYARLGYLSYLVQNTNRIKYLSRMVSETGNVSLIQDLLNHPNTTDITRIERIIDTCGDATANFGDPTPKYPTNNTGGDRMKMSPDHDKLGKLISLINNVTGGIGNVISLVNGVQTTPIDKFPILTDLILNIERMVYLNRTINEATNINLVVQLINNSPNSARLLDLLNSMGNLTYGSAVGLAADVSPKYGANPSGGGCATMSGFPDGKGCDTNNVDRLGKTVVMINEITNIADTIALVNETQDFSYVKDLIAQVNRIRYLTHIINHLQNVNLMIKIINGADACTVYVPGINDTTDNSTTCASAGGTWFGVGRCLTHPAQTTRAGCLAAGGIWRGAEFNKLLALINGVGDSRLRGNVGEGDLLGASSTSKAVGDMLVLYDVVNKLGYNGSTPRTDGQQVRVVRVINGIQYCGLKPAFDKYIQYGPSCVNASGTLQHQAYQYEEACNAAGYLWRAKHANNTNWVSVSDMYYSCNDPVYTKPTRTLVSGGYYNNNDPYDGRARLVTMMLSVNDGLPFSYVVGDVQDTGKTINMVNSTRRIRSLGQFLKWVPGQVTAALINDTHPAAINRSLVYLANNLDDDEDETAKAFASMVHFGTRIIRRNVGNDAGTSAPACLEFTGLGPRRLAAVLNLEAGPYLEGVLFNMGWQVAIAAMNCGWARDNGEHPGACPAVSWSDGASGGMYKAVGRSYGTASPPGNPRPTAPQCIRAREVTAGYKYGNYQWGTNQGVRTENCQAYLPEESGGSFVVTIEDETDRIIWNGLSSIAGNMDDGIGSNTENNNSTNNGNDLWSVLKGEGSGIVGWVMTTNNSWVGFPPPRGFDGTVVIDSDPAAGVQSYCTRNDENRDTNNWLCVQEGLNAGDLGNTSSGSSYGFYFGTYCSGANASGTGRALAQSCFMNGGSWKTERNYQSASCKLDPAVDAAIQPP